MLNENYAKAASAEQFTIARLTSASMPQVATLLVETQTALPDDQKHFIKPQSLTDLRRHAHYGFPVLGAIENNTGRLAAVLLMTPAEKAEFGRNLTDYPKEVMESGAAVVQCVAVHPAYQGHGLMNKMLKSAEELAAKEHIFELVAKVANSNGASTRGFLKASFTDAVTGIDPAKGYDVTYWKKSCESLAPKSFPIFNAPQHDNDEYATFSCY